MRFTANLMLLGAAFIWGTTFVAQMAGMEGLGPFSYAAARFFLGFISLLLLWLCFAGKRRQAKAAGSYISGWRAGMMAGCIMFVASSLQQVSMVYTTAGKAAFITCLYIIFVPLFAVVLKQHIRPENWVGAVLALTGLYLLSIKAGFEVNFGDVLLFISAMFWTCHILFIDHFAAHVDPVELSAAQIGMCFVFSLAVAQGFETMTMPAITNAWFAIFYGGVMSAGVAFTLQIIGQKYTEPADAAIFMSLESVFGAVSSCIILGEVMSLREVSGCGLMLAGMLLTQLGGRLFSKKRAN